MTARVFSFYNLKPSTDISAYKEWSRTVDQPTCARMNACHRFEVFLVEGGSRRDRFFDVVEDIEVESWEAWQETLQSEAFSQVSREWPNYADPDSLVSIYCERI